VAPAVGRAREALTVVCRLLLALILLVALGAAACASFGYYGQAVRGGLGILLARRPIAELVRDPATPPERRERLRTVLAIRDFAARELGLAGDDSYSSYVELGRRHAVWTVVAAPELSVEPVQWCFPIAGCVTYRGYFSAEAARRFAARLAKRGFDVEVGGAAAYSTLGWFADPVLSTFLDLPDADLAALLFHELAHRRVYVKDDTTFNESFAGVVEAEGVRRWLEAQGREAELVDWRERREREREAIDLLLDYRGRLAGVYAATAAREWKLERKRELFAGLAAEYRARRSAWAEGTSYDGWFDGEPNNARLAAIGAYSELVPAFEALLLSVDGELPRFYAAVETLANLPAAQRRGRLDALAPSRILSPR
jgi:predicted aminopeptidase